MKALGDKFVCTHCFKSPGIKEFIESMSSHTKCSYCGRVSDGEIAAHINDVTIFIYDSLMTEYELAINCLGYESAEGGYQGPTTDFDDVLRYSGELEVNNEELIQDILEAMPDEPVVGKDFFYDEAGELRYTWERFSEQVMHRQRYVFFKVKTVDKGKRFVQREPEPYEILVSLGAMTRELGLIRILEPGTQVFRAREHPAGRRFRSVADLGVPPPEKASQSRMSPAGIPVFYGALDDTTAQVEVESDDPTRACVTIGRFLTLKPLRVLDLGKWISIPSIFEERRRHERAPRKFLNEFIEDISEPIEKDGRIHVEYVPTQIVAEYFRHIFVDKDGKGLDGILYPSAHNQEGVCCVLFLGQNDRVADEDSGGSLQLMSHSTHKKEARRKGIKGGGREPKRATRSPSERAKGSG